MTAQNRYDIDEFKYANTSELSKKHIFMYGLLS